MAEKKDEKRKEEKKHSHHSGGMSFGLEVLLFIIGIFILWILAGGAKKEPPQSPIIKPDAGQTLPSGILN